VQEAQVTVEAFGARIGVQDDLLVPFGECHKLADDGLADAASLVSRMHGYVGDIGAVESVSQDPTGTDEHVFGVHEAHEPAVAEHGGERVRRLVSERGDCVEAREFRQVHGFQVVDPRIVGHRVLLSVLSPGQIATMAP